ncbi:hypothetical protein [Flavobacterium sp. 1355]|jgi:hypothetical protein|uniref:hypothetical protein n=1 Tax=Flavobacterium sp. 1355 TaxID=2806571 RepID=UPI001AE115EA|nr:hypothetical protein [Flavobacterium sp. 1355]MBP1221734.1 hypothetical protein [Flavobacterium sp. 1355]
MNDIKLGTFQIFEKNVLNNDFSFENDNDIIFINFGSQDSIKIIPFFEKIKKGEVEKIIEIFKSLEINLRLDDLLGKLHIVIVKILLDDEKRQILIIDDVGFTSTSIKFLQLNFCSLMSRFKNKAIIVLGNEDN